MLAERTEKARAALHFAQIVSTDASGHVTKVRVPGSQMKRYIVILRRNGYLSAECLLETGIGEDACKGNSHGLCYHALAALMVAAGLKDSHISFCSSQADADRLAFTGGQVYPVKSHQSQASLWMVAKSVAEARDSLHLEPAQLANGDRAVASSDTSEGHGPVDVGPQPSQPAEASATDLAAAEQRRRDRIALYGE